MRNCLALAAAVACLAAAGCGSTHSNPPVPRANTGYVDFYTDSYSSLSWDVKRADETTDKMRTVFLDYKPLEGNVLRLSASPGTHQFQVWFNNQVTEGPVTLSVPVQEGHVTPVHVTLKPAGEAAVQEQSYVYRSTARGTRRVTRIGVDEAVIFEIGALPAAPQPYQPKQQMPYWRGSPAQ